MNRLAADRLTHFMAGVDMSRPASPAHLVWITDDSPWTGAADFTFCSTGGRGRAQLLGSFGVDADEAVLDGELIVETCAFSQLAYLSLAGPTYVTFESEDDLAGLRAASAQLVSDGTLPSVLTAPHVIMELAALAPGRFPLTRTVVSQGTATPFRGPALLHELAAADPHASAHLVAAFMLARLLSDGQGPWTFDVPHPRSDSLADLTLARRDDDFRCLNLRTGRVFALGRDMYRAALSVLRPDRAEVVTGPTIDPEAQEGALRSLQDRCAA